jgi:hypothetical protein
MTNGRSYKSRSLISLALESRITASAKGLIPNWKRAIDNSELLILPGKREFLCAVKKTEGFV